MRRWSGFTDSLHGVHGAFSLIIMVRKMTALLLKNHFLKRKKESEMSQTGLLRPKNGSCCTSVFDLFLWGTHSGYLFLWWSLTSY